MRVCHTGDGGYQTDEQRVVDRNPNYSALSSFAACGVAALLRFIATGIIPSVAAFPLAE